MNSVLRNRQIKSWVQPFTLLLLFASAGKTFAAESSSTEANKAGPPKKLVSIKQAKQEEINPVVWLSGNVTSRLNVNLATEQNGVLLWVLDVGTVVKKGQSIAKLDSREFEFQLTEKQAQLRQQQANTLYLKKQLKRLKSLVNNNSTAEIELDRTERDLSIAEDELLSLKVQVDRIKLAIEKSTIRAPFEGRINRRMARQSEYVTSGSTLVQLVDPNALDISISAPLSVAPFLVRGDKMLVKWQESLVALPVRTWSPAGEQSSRSFNVRLDASDLGLMSGNAVVVSLPNERASLATMVPRDALILRTKETFIMAVDSDRKVHKVEVEVGRGFGEWISVSGKISAGDQVVVRGGESLQDGQAVRFDFERNDSESSVASFN